MKNASEAKAALKKELALEQQHLDREMKDSEVEIQSLLEKWRMRMKELEELEESVELKEAVRNAKIAISGRLAAAKLMKYGREYDPACVIAAQKLLGECEKIDGELSSYFNGNGKQCAIFQKMLDREYRETTFQAGEAINDKIAADRML